MEHTLNTGDMEILKTIALVALPFFLAIIGWFLRILAKEMHDMRISLSTLSLGQALSKKDIDFLNTAVGSFKSTIEDVSSLKSEHTAIWREFAEIHRQLPAKGART